jgi:fructan beta-fructosidase
VLWLTSDLDGNPRSPGSYDLGALEGQEVWYDVYLPLVTNQHPLAMESIFFADFEDGTLTGWTSSQGTWTNPGDHMRGEHTGSAWNMHTSSGDNIVYTGTVTLVSGDAAGLVFRSSADGSSSYDVTLDASDDAFKIGRRAPYQMLGSYPVTVQYNRSYEIKVVASGGTIEAYLDGRRLLTVTDTTYTSGRLGVMVYQSTATYDDLTAWEIP